MGASGPGGQVHTKKLKAIKVAASVTLITSASTTYAADFAYEAPQIETGWTFTLAPYVWAAGISGDVGLFGIPPQEVDASFSDILNRFDIGAMVVGEARNGPFFLGSDLFYVKLGTDIDTPAGLVADNIDISSTTFMFTGFAGYSLIYDESANFDVFAGARIWHSDTEFDLNNPCPLCPSSVDDGDTWVDPIIGVKGRTYLGHNVYVTAWGMIGGFGVSSDLMWDVLGAVGYDLSDTLSFVGGYRAISVEYENDGFVYDVIQQGPILGAVFRF